MKTGLIFVCFYVKFVVFICTVPYCACVSKQGLSYLFLYLLISLTLFQLITLSMLNISLENMPDIIKRDSAPFIRT